MSIFKKKKDGEVLVRKYDDDLDVENGHLGNIQDLFGEKDQTSGVQAIKEINSKDNIEMKSELSKGAGESYYFTKLIHLSSLLSIPGLERHSTQNLILRVSNDRAGRKESVDISRQTTVDEKQKGLFRRMMS
jgi:hypothetical protein